MAKPRIVRARGGAALVAAAWALAACAPSEPPPARPHLVLVTLDTTRVDRLGVYGYGRPTSPRLDALAAEGTVFERAWSTSTWTLPAHASLFTGKFPTSHGARYDPQGPLVLARAIRGPKELGLGEVRARGLAPGEPTLAALLHDAGYQTAAVVAGPWMKRVFGLAHGFEHYDDAGIESLNGRRAAAVTDAAIAWLERRDERPFFLFLNYFDPHTPFLPPYEFLAAVTPPAERPQGEARTLVELSGLYDAEIRTMDHHLGRLLDRLRALELWNDTWIAVTADHGELLGEHGMTGHGRSLFEPELRVPLVVKPARGDPRPARRSDPVQLGDLFAMVLERAGVARPAPAQGVPPPGAGRPVFAEVVPLPVYSDSGAWWALVEDGHKYLETERGLRLLFDLASDPGEDRNLVDEDPERAERLAAALRAFRASLPAPPPAGPAGEVDPETREALRSLGYVE